MSINLGLLVGVITDVPSTYHDYTLGIRSPPLSGQMSEIDSATCGRRGRQIVDGTRQGFHETGRCPIVRPTSWRVDMGNSKRKEVKRTPWENGSSS